MGRINLTKAAMVGLDSAELIRFITRGVAVGAYGIVNDADSEVVNLDNALGEIGVKIDRKAGRTEGTLAFASTLYLMSMTWTYSKMRIADRAAFLSSVSVKMFQLFDDLNLYMSNIKVATIRLAKVGMNEKLAAEIGLDLISLRANIERATTTAAILEDTLNTLEYVNTMGQPTDLITDMLYLDANKMMTGATRSLLNGDDVMRLRAIADSNVFFERRGVLNTRGVSPIKGSFNIFVNPDLAMAADMFLPSNSADDLFNIKNELANTRANIKVFTSNGDTMKALSTNMDDLLKPYMTVTKQGAVPKAVLQALEDSGKVLFNYTTTFANDQDAIRDVKKALDAKLGTAVKATDSFLIRASSRVVQTATYVSLRPLGGRVARNVSVATAAKFKVGAKFLGKAMFWDTVLWGITGAFDLAFVDEDKEYPDPFRSYLADNIGFSFFNLLVDSVIDFFVPTEVQDEFLQALQTLLAGATAYDSINDMVLAVINFYIDEVNLTVFPYDILAPQTIERPFDIKSLLRNADPLMVLEAFTYACVAKIVFSAWIVPSVGFFTRQVGWATTA